MPGKIALVGSGEYLPEMQDLEEWLLTDKPPRYVQLATAASLEGEESLRRWHDLGARAAERLGVEQVIVDVRTRQDAENADYAEAMTRLEPCCLCALYELGKALCDAGEYSEARKRCTSALLMAPPEAAQRLPRASAGSSSRLEPAGVRAAARQPVPHLQVH